jgi:hypothetical protein
VTYTFFRDSLAPVAAQRQRFQKERHMPRKTLATLTFSTLAIAALPAPWALAADALTIYSSAQPGSISPDQYRPGAGAAVPGYAMVRHERDIVLTAGRNKVRFSDVAAKIDPTTVSFESPSDPESTRVVEQNYQFDLINSRALLDKYLDREVSVDEVRGNTTETITGTLASSEGGLILRAADGSVRVVNNYAGMKLPGVPGGLISKPTLLWDVAAEKAGTHKIRVAYQTSGITWWADYNLTYAEGKSAEDCRLDVSAWVTVVNQSGATYSDTKLKLIAGDVQRIAPGRPVAGPEARVLSKAMEAAPGFEEKPFFEYHLYTLGFPTTLPDNSTKQLELFPAARGVSCRKNLVYFGQAPGIRPYGGPLTDRNYGVQGNTRLDVYLSFKNSRDNHLGMPLPAGRVRVSKLDEADKSLEFIGEDVIHHTPRDEDLLVRMGSAFDVVGERRQMDFRLDTTNKVMEEDIEVKLRNRKDEPVTVMVRENLYRWTSWSIVRKSQDFEKMDSRTIQFPLRLAKGAEGTVRYTARYTW